jgi:hypothetical protein
MTKKNLLIIVIMILLTIGVIGFLSYSQPPSTPQTPESIVNQIKDNAQTIAQNQNSSPTTSLIPTTNVTQSEPQPQLFTDTPIANTQDATDKKLITKLSTYKVAELLNGSIVYDVPNAVVTNDKVLFQQIDLETNACLQNCILIESGGKFIFGLKGVYYLTSFSKENKVFWLSFVKSDDGFVTALISEENFKNSKEIIFTNSFVSKILEPKNNSGEIDFEIRSGNGLEIKTETISVNFREKI